ncbi:penicillin-binding protein [Polaribacter reichenbachii]|uniref:Penicillin-binding protein n=1 Tax=Polaribacter reichenbachii TaxID=996801 RepID=A0A1B8U009_9FLAO|nr:serine hydrolase domain-containing protein [Polaribacter reichenbachii]APZ47118.1 penicillin-binding protein [Polaribacter reichenbachii]AUC17759.1 penicillin-binding protein [Polaribacter reichenbachii]OBY65218.1 penicillin-binding protein [Polaribacter reichenbachii]
MNSSIKALFFAFITFLTLNPFSQSTNKELFNRIDTYLKSSETNGFSGVVLVSKKGKIILSKGYGWADRKNKIPNSPSTVFNIGSVTKQFTASAILKLVEQGKIKTSDKISTYFAQTPIDKSDITIHQLLTHTSGISNRTGGFRYDEASKEQFLKEFFESELQSKPGTKHQYANANYIMLTAIIERVSGQTYNSFLNDFLFVPSQMNSTGYKSVNFSTERLAHGYYYNRNDEQWEDWGTTQEHLPYNDKHWYSIGKGDIHSTVEDLYKWNIALKNNVVLASNTKLVQETPYVAENDKKTSFYAYGWAISQSKRDTKIVAHNGSNGLYFADFVRFVDDDVVIIYITNVFLGPESEYVAREIGKMIFDSNYTPSPISRNIYELSFEFMKTNPSSNAAKLPVFLKKKLNNEFKDHAILNRLGFSRLKKEDKPDWALELFKLNVKLFPKDGNLWDSLGEAYLKYNMNDEAIKSYTKAVELGNESSRKVLNELLKKE